MELYNVTCHETHATFIKNPNQGNVGVPELGYNGRTPSNGARPKKCQEGKSFSKYVPDMVGNKDNRRVESLSRTSKSRQLLDLKTCIHLTSPGQAQVLDLFFAHLTSPVPAQLLKFICIYHTSPAQTQWLDFICIHLTSPVQAQVLDFTCTHQARPVQAQVLDFNCIHPSRPVRCGISLAYTKRVLCRLRC